jgi:hypothetical protein
MSAWILLQAYVRGTDNYSVFFMRTMLREVDSSNERMIIFGMHRDRVADNTMHVSVGPTA